MLKFINNNHGSIEIAWSSLALLLVTGILLVVGLTTLFLSNWQRTDELSTFSSYFSTVLETMDARFYEHQIVFDFPEKTYPYTLLLTSQYSVITAAGYFNTPLLIKTPLVIQPWPRFQDENWTTGEDLHVFLNQTTGDDGTPMHPINHTVLLDLYNQWNRTKQHLIDHPLIIYPLQQVIVEKVIIYYETNCSVDFVLVYLLG